MALRPSTLDASLDALDKHLAGVVGPRTSMGPAVTQAIERLRADGAALRFHLRDAGDRPVIV
ncbi:MAG: hypothetical protein ABIP55_04910, partial [Tepidisphaeraceae bacterium]